jgi:hypothetical protein
VSVRDEANERDEASARNAKIVGRVVAAAAAAGPRCGK